MINPIVRQNLMNEPGYSPYCGAGEACILSMPRTKFDGDQFTCKCGWRSEFPEDFIRAYREKWGLTA